MRGSNNEVAVLESVLNSLCKSPAFALLEEAHTVSASNTETVTPSEQEQLDALSTPTLNELILMVPAASEETEFDRMVASLSQGVF